MDVRKFLEMQPRKDAMTKNGKERKKKENNNNYTFLERRQKKIKTLQDFVCTTSMTKIQANIIQANTGNSKMNV